MSNNNPLLIELDEQESLDVARLYRPQNWDQLTLRSVRKHARRYR